MEREILTLRTHLKTAKKRMKVTSFSHDYFFIFSCVYVMFKYCHLSFVFSWLKDNLYSSNLYHRYYYCINQDQNDICWSSFYRPRQNSVFLVFYFQKYFSRFSNMIYLLMHIENILLRVVSFHMILSVNLLVFCCYYFFVETCSVYSRWTYSVSEICWSSAFVAYNAKIIMILKYPNIVFIH